MMDSLQWSRDVLLILLLLASMVTDLRSRKILNAFTYPGFAAGLLLSATGGPMPLGDSAAGALLAAAILWPLCRAGGMGWGDLKLAAAAGALTGFRVAGASLVDGALIGGVAAVVIVLARGEFLVTVRRSLGVPRGIVRSLGKGKRPAFAASRDTTLPYGVAIAAGTAVARWGGWPW